VTVTTYEPYSANWTGEIITGVFTYVGSALGASSAGLITDVAAGKLLFWIIIMAVTGALLFLKIPSMNSTIVMIIELLLLVAGTIIGFIPIWIGIVIVIMAFAIVGYSFRSMIFGGA
jgi:hypothetical protein